MFYLALSPSVYASQEISLAINNICDYYVIFSDYRSTTNFIYLSHEAPKRAKKIGNIQQKFTKKVERMKATKEWSPKLDAQQKK